MIARNVWADWVSITDGSRERLTVPDSISDHGIDGLYRHDGRLIAIQNGIRPHRVVAFTLSDDGLAITGNRTLASKLPEFDEPTATGIDSTRITGFLTTFPDRSF